MLPVLSPAPVCPTSCLSPRPKGLRGHSFPSSAPLKTFLAFIWGASLKRPSLCAVSPVQEGGKALPGTLFWPLVDFYCLENSRPQDGDKCSVGVMAAQLFGGRARKDLLCIQNFTLILLGFILDLLYDIPTKNCSCYYKF